MTEEFDLHRYCDGIDCSWCGVPEPCIYKEANRLKEENEFLKEQIKTLETSIRIVQDETKTDN